MYKRVRTRFAPSRRAICTSQPAYALFAYLIAKKQDGDFILRIEDTDQERFYGGSLDIIYRTLEASLLNSLQAVSFFPAESSYMV